MDDRLRSREVAMVWATRMYETISSISVDNGDGPSTGHEHWALFSMAARITHRNGRQT
jgi:hypothetical protein